MTNILFIELLLQFSSSLHPSASELHRALSGFLSTAKLLLHQELLYSHSDFSSTMQATSSPMKFQDRQQSLSAFSLSLIVMDHSSSVLLATSDFPLSIVTLREFLRGIFR